LKNRIFIGFLIALVLVLFLSGCITIPLTGKEIQRFKSYDELVAKFQETGQPRYGLVETVMSGVTSPLTATMPMAVSESAGKAAAPSDGVSYSRTNVQVEGVDEADIVKTDGKFIYNFSANKLVIVDAFPIEGSAIASMTDLNNVMPLEMFVLNDRLLLFGNKAYYYGDYGEPGFKAERMPYYGSSGTMIQLYDVSNKAEPVLLKELEFDGSYLTSRLIGSNAYFVVNSWPRLYEDENNIIPLMVEDGVEKKIAEATEIGFISPMPVQSFITIASINLDSMELQKEVIAGNADNVFASLDNVYLASTAWLPREATIAGEIESIFVGGIEKTVVNKFNLAEGSIGFSGQGQVPGHILNQFSMDEFEENFRIATTAGQLSRGGSQTSNNVYVLSSDLKVIGRLEDLAPGESIYSARFMGEKAYLVTFKKVDPLFVIDLSDPTNPKVLGKLKIPGFSDYLHPIDENHLIGVGKEAIEAKGGDFAWYQGMKLAVFDVSNVEQPIELHKLVIGDRGTDSYALYDHKAFLYDKEKELLVLPIMLAEIPEEQKKITVEEGMGWPAYGEPVFQGAFVYRLTLENGFEERGRITHVSEEDELKRGYSYGDDYSVKRALFIDDVLYTLSERMLKANSLTDLQELKAFDFKEAKTA